MESILQGSLSTGLFATFTAGIESTDNRWMQQGYSASEFLWSRVKVDDLEACCNTQDFQLVDPFDRTGPDGKGQGFTH